MKFVWVWERTGQKESSSAFIPLSFLLLTQLSNYTQTCIGYYTPLLLVLSVWWLAAALILASCHCICNSNLQNISGTRQDFYRSQGQKQLSPLIDTESIMNVRIIPWLFRNWCHQQEKKHILINNCWYLMGLKYWWVGNLHLLTALH